MLLTLSRRIFKFASMSITLALPGKFFAPGQPKILAAASFHGAAARVFLAADVRGQVRDRLTSARAKSRLKSKPDKTKSILEANVAAPRTITRRVDRELQ